MPRLSGAAWIIAAAVLWSTGGAGIKLAPMPAMAVVCGRALFTVGFYQLMFRPAWRRASWPAAAVYAALILTFVYATKTTTAANAILLQYTAPVYVLIFAPLVLGEPFRRIDAGAVVVGLLGTALFFVDRLAPGSLTGNIVAMISGWFCAANAILLRREAASGDGDTTLPTITLGNALAAAIALPFAWQEPGAALSGPGLAVLAYLGIAQIGIAYLCFIRGLRTVPALDASLLGLLEAALNPVWTWLIAGERPGGWAIVGGAMILAASLVRTLVLEAQTRYASASSNSTREQR